jgi:hypothetical protein
MCVYDCYSKVAVMVLEHGGHALALGVGKVTESIDSIVLIEQQIVRWANGCLYIYMCTHAGTYETVYQILS